MLLRKPLGEKRPCGGKKRRGTTTIPHLGTATVEDIIQQGNDRLEGTMSESGDETIGCKRIMSEQEAPEKLSRRTASTVLQAPQSGMRLHVSSIRDGQGAGRSMITRLLYRHDGRVQ